jgi:hypothetical protein
LILPAGHQHRIRADSEHPKAGAHPPLCASLLYAVSALCAVVLVNAVLEKNYDLRFLRQTERSMIDFFSEAGIGERKLSVRGMLSHLIGGDATAFSPYLIRLRMTGSRYRASTGLNTSGSE